MLIQHQGKIERIAAIRMGAIKRGEVPGGGQERKDELMLIEFALVSETVLGAHVRYLR